MSRIEKINLQETIDYSHNMVEYFIEENNNSNLISYDDIISKIINAKITIQIASTSTIADNIIDALYQNNDLNIYIILKSFQNTQSTLNRFDEKKPAILREVNELDNNFIIIDNISYLFINSLNNKENIFIRLDEDKTKDLSYIFNYYFWDCARQEKLIDIISSPNESPFPPIGIRELEYINIENNSLEDCVELLIPRDKKYLENLYQDSEKKYFSENIQNSIYQNHEYIHVGKLRVKDNTLVIKNRWILKNSCLKDISTDIEIVPKEENWDTTINIEKSKHLQLSQIEANSIEDMEDTKPNEFKQELYIKSIIFNWEVQPPSKAKDSKKSSLYSEYDKLDSTFQEQLLFLNTRLKDLEKESGVLSFFSGANRKAKQNLKKIEEYKSQDLKDLLRTDLDNFLNKEFKLFYEDIISSDKNFKEDKKRKDAEDIWKNEKEQKDKSLKSKESELSRSKKELSGLKEKSEKKKAININIEDIEKNINQLKKEKKTYDDEALNLERLKKDFSQVDDKQKEQTKLHKNINSLESKIDNLNKEISDNYFEFKYNPKQNEIKNFNKNKTNSNEFKGLNVPKYILPEVGILFETQDSYYLEILDKKYLKKANELSQRYSDKKNYKVVAGGF